MSFSPSFFRLFFQCTGCLNFQPGAADGGKRCSTKIRNNQRPLSTTLPLLAFTDEGQPSFFARELALGNEGGRNLSRLKA